MTRKFRLQLMKVFLRATLEECNVTTALCKYKSNKHNRACLYF